MALCFAAPRYALATPQANDTVVIGGNTYGIFQLPMSGYWHHDDEVAKGRLPFPKFELAPSGNYRGYIAEWSISGGKLHLLSIEGQLDGKLVRDRQIIKKRLPIHANWFTGKIYVPVGDYNDEKRGFELVLEFTIEDGEVRSTAFHDSLKISMAWNGLPSVRPPESAVPNQRVHARGGNNHGPPPHDPTRSPAQD